MDGVSPKISCPASRLVHGKDDALFGAIEKQQGQRPFGSVLDAGTGLHSLRWIATLATGKGMTDFCAVTADKTMQTNVQKEAEALGVAHLGRVVLGNWFEDTNAGKSSPFSSSSPPTTLLKFPDASFDTILADYLIGSMDGFSPYQQDLIIPKLARLLKPGGRLYIVGLEPIPDQCEGDADIVCQVRRVRDACILLAGHRCYREYPLTWIKRHITQQLQGDESAAMELVTSIRFPILYRHATIVKQINVARSKFPLLQPESLKRSMAEKLDDLEKRSSRATQASASGRIQQGFDYVVVAEKKVGGATGSNGNKAAEACAATAATDDDHDHNHIDGDNKDNSTEHGAGEEFADAVAPEDNLMTDVQF